MEDLIGSEADRENSSEEPLVSSPSGLSSGSDSSSSGLYDNGRRPFCLSLLLMLMKIPLSVRADCLATNTEYCDRCTHAATQATNVARIKTEGTKGLLQGQVAVLESGWIKLACRRPIKSCG